jgi:hypothetical protein
MYVSPLVVGLDYSFVDCRSKLPLIISNCHPVNDPCCSRTSDNDRVLVKAWKEDVYPDVYDAYANSLGGSHGERLDIRSEGGRETALLYMGMMRRTVELESTREYLSVKGIGLQRFRLGQSFLQNAVERPANDRYYRYGPSGLVNVTHLKDGVGIFMSLPHFLHGDECLKNAVEGLAPDPNLHDFYLDVLALLRQPLRGMQRFQMNLYVEPLVFMNKDGLKVEWFKQLQPVYMPLMWLNQYTVVTDDAAASVRSLLTITNLSASIGKVGSYVASFCGVCVLVSLFTRA